MKAAFVSALFGVLAAAGAVTAAPASAASSGWDYISLPTWLGNCPGGGSVQYLQVMVGDTWSGGDAGDDLVYAKVVIGQNQTVVAEGLCYKGTQSYWGPASSQTIHPTRSGQTWWVGPAGVSHN
ncbi:hypothetical protein [Pseudofrankia inefficax]|uniref:hypothetical protein n=1 Tax=Pseudofrankia inefficax (strain DSM 45817 / CECT 9037 / DDB 130130 / EuI1c) TaxID=298654 RepID=UPI0012FDF3B9|nr:hypothetical protein [Pseudofrankia inefficax]